MDFGNTNSMKNPDDQKPFVDAQGAPAPVGYKNPTATVTGREENPNETGNANPHNGPAHDASNQHTSSHSQAPAAVHYSSNLPQTSHYMTTTSSELPPLPTLNTPGIGQEPSGEWANKTLDAISRDTSTSSTGEQEGEEDADGQGWSHLNAPASTATTPGFPGSYPRQSGSCLYCLYYHEYK